ncbi:hypothetical protein GCM10028803_53020 [Larkinella knui]|uniref:XRE family transcriptional regulator n=1 Tax=Larkinella knui TaxID=2025310 RepID=A0A3P1CGP1_9BACT|nr:helix-turn-helix transcriptional regulator [Larkinella knui]RRB12492.1 XRE family transcriptional regulator [Larkinella knui]
METTINERFKKLIEALGLNPNSFAKRLGKAQSSIAVIVEGKSKPGYELLEKVFANFPQVSRDWLLMGEGEMFRKEEKSAGADKYLQEHLQTLEKKFETLLAQKDSVIEGLQSIIRYQREQLGKSEVVLAYAAVCTLFFINFGYKFGYNLLTDAVNWL